MNHIQQIQCTLKRLPTIFFGVCLGAILMYNLEKLPVFIEVSWGPDSGHVRVDSRTKDWCELTES